MALRGGGRGDKPEPYLYLADEVELRDTLPGAKTSREKRNDFFYSDDLHFPGAIPEDKIALMSVENALKLQTALTNKALCEAMVRLTDVISISHVDPTVYTPYSSFLAAIATSPLNQVDEIIEKMQPALFRILNLEKGVDKHTVKEAIAFFEKFKKEKNMDLLVKFFSDPKVWRPDANGVIPEANKRVMSALLDCVGPNLSEIVNAVKAKNQLNALRPLLGLVGERIESRKHLEEKVSMSPTILSSRRESKRTPYGPAAPAAAPPAGGDSDIKEQRSNIERLRTKSRQDATRLAEAARLNDIRAQELKVIAEKSPDEDDAFTSEEKSQEYMTAKRIAEDSNREAKHVANIASKLEAQSFQLAIKERLLNALPEPSGSEVKQVIDIIKNLEATYKGSTHEHDIDAIMDSPGFENLEKRCGKPDFSLDEQALNLQKFYQTIIEKFRGRIIEKAAPKKGFFKDTPGRSTQDALASYIEEMNANGPEHNKFNRTLATIICKYCQDTPFYQEHRTQFEKLKHAPGPRPGPR